MNLYSYAIPAYRAKYGLSVEELGLRIGIPAERIRMFEEETLTPNYDELTKLANMKGWDGITVPKGKRG